MNACFKKEARDCSQFKTGSFVFTETINGEEMTTTFIRNKHIEISTFNNHIDTASVRWINDCEYILQNLHPKNMAEEKPIHIKIISTNKDGYVFEYGIVGENNKAKGKAIINPK